MMADPYVPDRVCERCSSRLKRCKMTNLIYCTSETCAFLEFGTALDLATSKFTVTGGGSNSSATADDAEQPAPVSTPACDYTKTGGIELENLEKKLDEAPEIHPNWEPAAGEKLVGEVMRKDTVRGFDMIVVKPANGEARTVWKITTLRDLFDKVKVGDAVGLKYLGEMKSEKGRSYKNTKFVLEPKD